MERGVEILNGGAASGTLPQGEVVDLTNTNKGAVDESVQEGVPPVQGQEGSVAQEGTEPKLDSDGKPIVAAPDATKPDVEVKDTESAAIEGEHFFAGQQVDIEVPDEISTAFTEAGLDQKEVLAELFAKDGKFELKAETRTKLDEKFGKLMVDGYLKMYKGLNDQQMAEIARQAKTQEEANKAIQTEYAEIVGGEKGLEALEAYVLTLDEKQVASYNAVMSGDSWDAQKMVLGMLRTQMQGAEQARVGDKEVKLLTDGTQTATGSGDVTDKGFLTAKEYQTLMDSDKYWTDPAYQRKVDAMRSGSIRSGK